MNQIDAKQAEENSPFRVTTPADLKEILNAILHEKALLQLRIPPGVASVMTSLLQVDSQAKPPVLLFDNPGEKLAQRAVEASKLVFETSLHQVQIRFNVPWASVVSWEGRQVLRTPFPESIFRLQRRASIRVKTPIAQPLSCHIVQPQGRGEAILPLEDISEGGIGLFDDESQLDHTVGREYEQVLLTLPGVGTVQLKLRTAQAYEARLPNGKVRWRMGLTYIDCDARTLTLIRRYIVRLQREEIARRRGLM